MTSKIPYSIRQGDVPLVKVAKLPADCSDPLSRPVWQLARDVARVVPMSAVEVQVAAA